MGTCVSRQTRPDGKPEEDREQPEVYSNSIPYFMSQLIALITHETYVISPNVTDTLLLTHIFYSDSITLLIAIRERFFLTYERYKFTTYQRECDITITYNPNTKTKKDIDSNRPMKRLPIPNSPTPSNPHTIDIITNTNTGHHQIQLSHSISTSMNKTPSPSPTPTPTPKYTNKNNISDELEIKNFDDNYGFPNTFNGRNSRSKLRDRSGTIDIGYMPTKKLDFIDWVINIKIVIQKKCLDLLLKWIENYWCEDFGQNDNENNNNNNSNEIIDILTEFINDIKSSRDQFQNLKNNKYIKKNKNKNKKYKNKNLPATHKIYASFIQSYLLKLQNIIATQQTWYKPIINELKLKQETATKLYNEQIKNSKRYRHNRLNSHNTHHINTHNRQSTNSVSAFSDNIFGDNLLQQILYDDSDNDIMDEKSPNLTVQSFNSPRKSYSKSKSISEQQQFRLSVSAISMDENKNNNNNIKMDINNNLSFISMKNEENANEYAKQLTLLDWELFINIEPRNCLYKIIKGKKENYISKWLSVKLFIDRFQQTHQYVIVSIIAAPDLKSRIEMIEFFIFVTDMLLKLNNLYSFMAIVTAIDSISVTKLKISWEFVDKNLITKFKQYLSPLCNPRNNYKSLRDYCKLMAPPGIPFLGLILKDLTFTNDGNKNKLSKQLNKHINFQKYILFHKILSENINKYKIKTYSKKIKHSKQFETQDINALVKELNIDDIKEEEEDDINIERDINIIPDIELQDKIIKDLNSYILLNKNVIRAMTIEANRIDMLKKDEYINQYVCFDNNNNKKRNSLSKSKSKKYTHFKTESDGNNNKKSKLSLKRFFGSRSNKKDDNKEKNMDTVKE